MIGLDGAGDTPAQLTDLPVDVDNLKWSPNGNYFNYCPTHPLLKLASQVPTCCSLRACTWTALT